MKTPPHKATCAVCMKRTQCVTTREVMWGPADTQETQNFQYSEIHNGWLCRKCAKGLEKEGTVVSGWPEREPLETE